VSKTKQELLDELQALGVPAESYSEDDTNEVLQGKIDDATPSDDDGPSVEVAPDPSELEHTMGGSTTKDALDMGVPMLQGAPDEPIGPEDALGEGAKRGDYTDRQDGAQHYESVANPKAGQPIQKWIKDGQDAKEGDEGAELVTVDYEPAYTQVLQNPRVEDIGEVPGEKGGVTT
jgi:hypothetical protein